MEDKTFVRGLFGLISFCLGTVPILYGIYVHNWWLVLGVFSGAMSVAIKIALKETKK